MSDKLKWCEECKLNHTEEFGKEFHNRIIKKFPLDLIGELVAVRTSRPENHVLLPDWKRSLTGTVLAKGPEVKTVKEGFLVSFGEAVGMDSVCCGQEIRILKEQDLDFIYENTSKCVRCSNLAEPCEIYCTNCFNIMEVDQIREIEHYKMNDDILPCLCKPGNPCAWHG